MAPRISPTARVNDPRTKLMTNNQSQIIERGRISMIERCNSAAFLTLLLYQIEKRSPNPGIAPITVLMIMFNAIRLITIFGTCIRTARKRIIEPTRFDTMSPRPGRSPSRGSSPIRMGVPGMRTTESRRRAMKPTKTWISSRSLSFSGVGSLEFKG